MTAAAAPTAGAGAAEPADVLTASEGYAQRFAGPVGAWFLDVQARATLELLAPWPRARVLEVGGGHGQLTGALLDAGHAVTVHGSRPECAERVRSWVEQGRARFACGDLLRLPFGDRTFDVILAFRLLPHVKAWHELVRELCRVAGRAVVVDYPTLRSVNAASRLLFRLKHGVEGDTRPFTVFHDADVGAAFEDASFVVTGRRPQFLLPMALHRALRAQVASRAAEGLGAVLGLRRAYGSPVVLRAERRA